MPILTENDILEYGYDVERIFYDLENSIIDSIVKSLKKVGEITATGDYQIDVLRSLGMPDEEIRKKIQEALNASDKRMQEIFEDAAEKTWAVSKDLYTDSGKTFVPAGKSPLVTNIVNMIRKQTMGEMINITQTIGFVAGGKFTPAYQYLIKTLDDAAVQIISGAFDYNSVLKKAVGELTASGLRWVDYESGHHNRVTVAARRAVMTGMRQMTQEMHEATAKELDTQFFEVSAHNFARPEHAKWQGKVYSKKQLISVCGLGTGPGLQGWNCYHQYYPFIRGVSKRAYTKEQLEAFKDTSTNPKYEWKGKKLTGYQGTQEMRKLETRMRAQREKIHLLKLGGASEKDIKEARSRYRVSMSEYKNLAKTLGVKTQTERIYIDGLGRV